MAKCILCKYLRTLEVWLLSSNCFFYISFCIFSSCLNLPFTNVLHIYTHADFFCLDETSGMDSDLEDDTEESGEPLAKREKSEHEVIQVIQVGALEDGSHPVVGVVQPGVLHSLPQPPQDHTEHILTPSAGTPTIRHCSATGNTYASVWGSEGTANLVWPIFAISLSTYLSLCKSRCFRLFHALSLSALEWTPLSSPNLARSVGERWNDDTLAEMCCPCLTA